MNTSQLLCVLKCDQILKHINNDVLAKDELPKAPLKHFPSAYIVNSDLSSQKGHHWLAFYFDKNKNGYFFDSYGNSPQRYGQVFVNFLFQNAIKYQYNSSKLQNDHSDVCGQYCVLFLMLKAREHSMSYIINGLTFDFNDQYVYDLITTIFDACFSSQITCTVNQFCKPRIVLL